jgi:hypothetical protein
MELKMAELSIADKLKALLQGTGAPTANASSMYVPQATPQQPPVTDVSDDTTDQSSDPGNPPSPSGQGTSPQSTVGLATYSGLGGLANPAVRKITDALRAKLDQSQNQQQGNIDMDKQALLNQYARKQDIDWSGANQMIAASGSNKDLAAGYKAPIDQTAQDAALRAALGKDQQNLTSDQTNELKAELQSKLMGGMYQQQRMDLMRDRLNQQIYGKQIQRLSTDKPLNNIVDNNNKITRTSDVLFAPGTDVNTTSLHDLQQTVTGALTGLSGGGGVGERAQRYMTDLDTDLAQLKQKFGDTNSIPRNDPILLHYMGLAQAGQAFLQDQARKKIDQLAGGHEDITEQPQFADMYHKQIDAVKGNLLQPKFLQVAAPSAQNVQQAYGAQKAVAGMQTPGGRDYDGSTPIPQQATPEMKQMRVNYLKQKAGHG